jgi:DNA-binding transcriptional LysR family regulator
MARSGPGQLPRKGTFGIVIGIRRIRYFTMLAETLHFGRAAARLNVSQPPLSRHIAALERELGVSLFERSSRSVTLTRAGERFYADAKAILRSIEQAAMNAIAAGRGEQGTLFLGFTSCAAYNVVPVFARLYAAAFPDVRFKIRELLADEIMTDLSQGKIDAAIMFPPEQAANLQSRTVHSEHLCVALPSKHLLARTPRLRASDLASDPFVIAPRAAAPALYDSILGYCRDAGFEPHVRLETNLQQTILNFVAEGVGVALVPESMSRARMRGVVFKALMKAPTVHQTLLWSRGNRNPCLAGFLSVAQSK